MQFPMVVDYLTHRHPRPARREQPSLFLCPGLLHLTSVYSLAYLNGLQRLPVDSVLHKLMSYNCNLIQVRRTSLYIYVYIHLMVSLLRVISTRYLTVNYWRLVSMMISYCVVYPRRLFRKYPFTSLRCRYPGQIFNLLLAPLPGPADLQTMVVGSLRTDPPLILALL